MPRQPSPFSSSRWIVNPWYDLCFFIGAIALSLAVCGAHLVLARYSPFEARTGLLTFIVFTGLFDAPHIFQTFSRTHADRTEYARHRSAIVWGLAGFLALGELASLLHLEAVVYELGGIFGVWHILAQNVGFLKMYKGLHRDTDRVDNRLDLGLVYAVVAAGLLGWPAAEMVGPGGALGRTRFGPRLAALQPGLAHVALGLFLIVAVLFAVRQVARWRTGRSLNAPKLLFLGTLIPFYCVLYFGFRVPFLVFVAVETTYHDVQYQGWISFYQRRRFPKDPAFARRWFLSTLGLGLAVGAATLLAHPAFRLLPSGSHRLATLLFEMPYFTIVLYHYFIDGVIWRLREAPELRALVFNEHLRGLQRA